MSQKTMSDEALSAGSLQTELRIVWIFCLVTLVLTVTVLFLLPGYGGPAIVVFIPALTAMALIGFTAGSDQVQPRLFNRAGWRLNLKWLLISLALALVLRLGVSLLGLLLAAWPFLAAAVGDASFCRQRGNRLARRPEPLCYSQ